MIGGDLYNLLCSTREVVIDGSDISEDPKTHVGDCGQHDHKIRLISNKVCLETNPDVDMIIRETQKLSAAFFLP